MTTPNRICIKVKNLRDNGYVSIEDWVNTPNNLYVGRKMGVFIYKDGEKKKYVMSGSLYQNPNSLNKIKDIRNNLEIYREHLMKNIQPHQLIKDLKGKTLGCWCLDNQLCHTDILIDVYTQYVKRKEWINTRLSDGDYVDYDVPLSYCLNYEMLIDELETLTGPYH